MAEAQSALPGAAFEGIVSVRETGPCGMITLRGDLASAALAGAVGAAAGAGVPGQRGIIGEGGNRVAWMSPDELLLMVAHEQVPGALKAIEKALAGEHHLAVDVSDARAMFEIAGPSGAVRETLAKLCPVDMAPGAFGPGEIRRTRMAQVPAAFWMPDEGCARVVCFRSVAEYVFGLLKDAALPGGEVGIFG